MEVHAHTHSSRKKWTHYLWEFLMLFLAVFCGFLAENQREHIVEKKRAKQYAKGLLFDLDLDRGELQRGIKQTRFILASIDSLIAIGSRSNPGGPVPGAFYYYGRFSTGFFRIDWSKASIDQLIQSGNLRYFTNKDLIGAINFYYYMAGIINAQNQLDMIQKDKIADLRNEILLSRYYSIFTPLNLIQESNKQSPSASIEPVLSQTLPLQDGATRKMDVFINNALDRKARLATIVERYYTLTDTIAGDIMTMLKKEYHLESFILSKH